MPTLASKPLLIIQMGTPPDDLRQTHGDQGDWFRLALAPSGNTLQICNPALGDLLPSHTDVCAAIVTGSWSMVTDLEDWSERTAEWLRVAMDKQLPLLGVCYGHQLLSHALGGVVDYHPRGREIGVQPVSRLASGTDDALLVDLPDTFTACLTHEQTVLRPPPHAIVLGSSAHDPHQILRYGPHALSVQFHPEFDAALMSAVIQRRASTLRQEGLDPDGLLQQVNDTPHARRILLQFAHCYGTTGQTRTATIKN